MNQIQSPLTLENALTLIKNEDRQQTLTTLENVDCILACWIKGKIHFAAAEEIAKSFTFEYYATDDMISAYRNLLNRAYDHLYKAVFLLPHSELEVRLYLNQRIWRELAEIQNELARTLMVEEEEELDFDDIDDNVMEEERKENLVGHLNDWKL